MQSTFRLARWEWFRLHHRVPFIFLAGLAFVIPFLSLLVRAFQKAGWLPLLGESGYIGAAASSLAVVSPVLAIVLSSFTHANDLQNGASRTLTARGASRESVIMAKSQVAASLLLAFHVIVLALAIIFSAALDPQFLEWQDGVVSVFTSWMISLLYLALGIALCQWRQSGSFTVGVGISIIFVEAIFYPLANGMGALQDWPVAELTAWTLWGITQGLQGNNSILSTTWYIPISIGYIAALTALGAVAFHKFDLRAGSE